MATCPDLGRRGLCLARGRGATLARRDPSLYYE